MYEAKYETYYEPYVVSNLKIPECAAGYPAAPSMWLLTHVAAVAVVMTRDSSGTVTTKPRTCTSWHTQGMCQQLLLRWADMCGRYKFMVLPDVFVIHMFHEAPAWRAGSNREQVAGPSLRVLVSMCAPCIRNTALLCHSDLTLLPPS